MTVTNTPTVFLQTGNVVTALDSPQWYPEAAMYLGVGSLDYHGQLKGLDPDSMYREHRSIRTIVGFIARNFAQVSLHAFQTDEAGDRDRLPADRKLSRLLRSPDGVRTGYEFARERMTDLCLWDRFAALKVRGDAPGSLALRRIPPRNWRFVRNAMDEPVGIRVLGADEVLDLDKFLWLDGYPAAQIAPMAHLAELIVEERESAKHRAQMWKGGARVGGVIERPVDAPSWSPKARQNFLALWRAAFNTDGAMAGGDAMLEDGMVYKPVQMITSRDAQQLESRKLAIAEVASAFYVPPQLVGVTDNANYSNVTAYRKILYDDTLGPHFMHDGQAWNARVVGELESADRVFVEHNVAEKLRLSFEEQAAILTSAIGGPYLKRNEGRRRMNLPAVDGGDELIQPLNVTTIDAATAPKPTTFAEKVEQAGQLIRAGFDAAASCLAVGLPPIEHTGLVPITVTQNPADVEDDTVAPTTEGDPT